MSTTRIEYREPGQGDVLISVETDGMGHVWVTNPYTQVTVQLVDPPESEERFEEEVSGVVRMLLAG